MRIQGLKRLAFLGIAASLSAGAVQAACPDKTVQYIIPFTPGGESDYVARMGVRGVPQEIQPVDGGAPATLRHEQETYRHSTGVATFPQARRNHAGATIGTFWSAALMPVPSRQVAGHT